MIDDINQKMSNSIKHLEKEFNTIRTSRANPSMLDNIFADAYGSNTPLNQLGNISTPENGNPLSIIYSENNFTETLIDPEWGAPVINYEETDYIKRTLENTLEVKINALINTKSAEILSRPSILVLDGRQARIQVGQQIPITKQPMVSGNTNNNFVFHIVLYNS